MKRIFKYLAVLVLVAAIGINYYQNYGRNSRTKRAAEYGKQYEIKIDKSAIKREEFKIKYDEAEWKALQNKLNLTRYFNRLENVPDFSFGFNPEYAKELITYWRKSFDWKKQIDRLNKYQQYRITINNTIIHYIYHETNKGKSTKPTINLLLVDGWPGCSFSFHDMIGHIEKEFKDLSFRIFVPSIPGYGYSTPLNHPLDYADTAFLFDAIMRYENAEEYFVHGEDWGLLVTTSLAQLFPNRVRGIHMTGAVSSEFSSLVDFGTYLLGAAFPSTLYTQKELDLNFHNIYSFSGRLWKLWFAFGYLHLQSTKPDTLAHGLTDSPVGLLAYVLEKYSSWSFDYDTEIVGKRDGGLDNYKKDELLSIITIYWMTNSIGSSVRYYKNNFGGGSINEIKKDLDSAKVLPQVRVGIQVMKNDVSKTPLSVVKMRYPNVVQYNFVDGGGHFAALDKPLESARNLVQLALNSL